MVDANDFAERSDRPPDLVPVSAIDRLGFCRAGFIGRLPGVEVRVDRELALARLRPLHETILRRHGFRADRLATAEQVHGRGVAHIEFASATTVAAVDGLVTAAPGICLGIYVADCAAVWLADPANRAVGLVHSGKRGTDLRILESAVVMMTERFGSNPAQMLAVVGPCIRPPHYEVDFAAAIVAQADELGIGSVVDDGSNTAADPEKYYSYRMEMGQTGRMLAVISISD